MYGPQAPKDGWNPIGCLPALLLPILLVIGWCLTMPTFRAVMMAWAVPFGFLPYLKTLGENSQAAYVVALAIFAIYPLAAIISALAGRLSVTLVCGGIIIVLFVLNVRGCREIIDGLGKIH